MSSEFFKSVLQQEFATIDGKFKGKLPVFYYDNTSMTAIYTASTTKVRQYLPLKEMHPVEVFPGRCLVGFSAFEYRKTDIDPYNEFSISIIISFGKKTLPGLGLIPQILKRNFTAYVWHLPVTTEIARYGGVELYGYPKFIADIKFTRKESELECTLSEKGKHILTLTGKKLPVKKGKVMRFRTYSVKDRIPLVANIYTNPIEFSETRAPDAARLEIGNEHPITKELKSIELSNKPLTYQYIPKNEVILFAPRNLIDD
jgi:hypothetical protein